MRSLVVLHRRCASYPKNAPISEELCDFEPRVCMHQPAATRPRLPQREIRVAQSSARCHFPSRRAPRSPVFILVLSIMLCTLPLLSGGGSGQRGGRPVTRKATFFLLSPIKQINICTLNYSTGSVHFLTVVM